MPRLEEKAEVLTLENLVTPLRKVGSTTPAPPGDRYRLQPSIFGGNSDVVRFIKEFEDVATIAEWPALVRLLQLRSYLTRPAKSYALGDDIHHIFQAFRAQFGMTTRDAKDKLQSMRRDRRTSLQDHADTI